MFLTFRKVAITTGALGAAMLLSANVLAYQESPMLAERVAAGSLPPLEDRLPAEPLVRTGGDIGKYGGTVRYAHKNIKSGGDFYGWSTTALPFDWDGSTIVGGYLKGWEWNNDEKTDITVYLREGLKWSDGHPVTTKDIMFRWYDVGANPEVPSGNRAEPTKNMWAIDDYTFRVQFNKPFPRYIINMANENGADWNRIVAFHFFKQWHADYNPDAPAMAEAEGFDSWGGMLKAKINGMHSHPGQLAEDTIAMNAPTLRPYRLIQATESTVLYERNPYHFMVDTAGNQLPYIDRVQARQIDVKSLPLAIINGELDFASFGGPRFEDYALYKANEEKGNYRVSTWPGNLGGQHTVHVNQTYSGDSTLRGHLRDIRLRRAMSLAIDRDEMNETLYYGVAVPRAATVVSAATYYDPAWGEEHPYARYDPAAAEALLDEMGLTPDANGVRIDLGAMIFYTGYQATEGFEMIAEYWGNVGIKIMINDLGTDAFFKTTNGNDWTLSARRLTNAAELGADRGLLQGSFVGPRTGPSYAPSWGQYLWAQLQIENGTETLADYGGSLPGEKPTDEAIAIWEGLKQAFNAEYASDEYIAGWNAAFGGFAEQLYVIGTVGMTPDFAIANNSMGNVHGEHGDTNLRKGMRGVYYPMAHNQLYFK